MTTKEKELGEKDVRSEVRKHYGKIAEEFAHGGIGLLNEL